MEIARLRWPDDRTRADVAKHNPAHPDNADRDTVRRLKRYVARELFPIIIDALSRPSEETAMAA